MAETLINNTLGSVPMASLPYVKSNQVTEALTSGILVTMPVVALAYSYAVLEFRGTANDAGAAIDVICGGSTVGITIAPDGKAQVSLVPFIRADIASRGVLEDPLSVGGLSAFTDNGFRGYIDVDIEEAEGTAATYRIYYIFGNYSPRGAAVTDVWLDYDAYGGNWCAVDAATHYTAAGAPTSDTKKNWCNIDSVLSSVPAGDFYTPIPVAWYYGDGNVRFSVVNYHFRYDCRTDNVVKVRWLDTDGNYNSRKFTAAGRSHGASAGDSWQRPHYKKTLPGGGYYAGRDEWTELTSSETLTIGDDNIPMEHYNWLKAIASSAAVEAYLGGAWVRCNLNGAAVECDPRRSVFSVTLALVLPADDVQQF